MSKKVLMVCLGNICRSPLAEGILKSMVDPTQVIVDSAGTGSFHIGNAPDPRSIEIALQHHIDIRGQRCRVLTKDDLDIFDHIFVMDKTNYQNVLRLCKSQEQVSKTALLLPAAGLGQEEVPDPYYGGKEGFAHVFDLIASACSKIAQNLKED